MIIFPDIEIQDGRCVNRIRGKEQEPEVYEISPMDAAQRFVAAGADHLTFHIEVTTNEQAASEK